eukprot:9398738-Pyramimonas_sp.AAC.1
MRGSTASPLPESSPLRLRCAAAPPVGPLRPHSRSLRSLHRFVRLDATVRPMPCTAQPHETTCHYQCAVAVAVAAV